MDRDLKGRFIKGMSNPNKGRTKRVNVCTYCGKEFIRKKLYIVKTGLNKGKNGYCYSKVKYCNEHKHLSRWDSERAKMAGKKSAKVGIGIKALKEWRKNGGRSWNYNKKGVQTCWNKGTVGVMKAWNKGKQMKEETKQKLSLALRGRKLKEFDEYITPKDKRERLRFRKYIQKQVFERDNYTCQMCGIRGGYLQVDHIQSWAEYVELRFDMNNCRTLCQKCHYKITFGRTMPDIIKTWGHNLCQIREVVN